jgi:hypothetical protein
VERVLKVYSHKERFPRSEEWKSLVEISIHAPTGTLDSVAVCVTDETVNEECPDLAQYVIWNVAWTLCGDAQAKAVLSTLLSYDVERFEWVLGREV